MASFKIGERDLAVARPGDLDEQLLAATGCTASEHAAMLRRVATPYSVARALQPFLGGVDAMPVIDLAELIASSDTGAVAVEVANLLAPPASEVADA